MDEHTSKRHRKDCSLTLSSKRRRPDNDENSDIHEEPITGWQAALGTSLAEQLEKLTEKRNLTARQVKKLLRAVLTNEDVVSAFRRYINLSEPETGEPSITTKRRVNEIGSYLESVHEQQSGVEALEPRVITRSLSRTIQHSLRDYLTPVDSDACESACTILDMEFSDDDDDDEEDQVTDIGTRKSAESGRTTKRSSKPRDADYSPGPIDFFVLERDRILDTIQNERPPSKKYAKDGSHLTPIDETSRQSASSEDSWTLSTVGENSTDFTTWLEDTSNHSMTGYTRRLRSGASLSASQQVTTEYDDHVPNEKISFADDEDTVELSERSTASAGNTPNDGPRDTEEAEDDTVYAEFLRSLFGSAHTTPTKNRTLEESAKCLETSSGTLHQSTMNAASCNRNVSATEDDDPDDPEFDVMAELDQVDREDFIDELRDDRAVRVSKMEAKSLHQDLRELFSDEEDDTQKSVGFGKSRASAVLAMKSHCHRFLQARRFLKQENLAESYGPEGSQSEGMPHSETGAKEYLRARDGRGSGPQRHFVYPHQAHLNESQRTQLQRQLGMHVQLLTTNFLLSYDYPHLHFSVTRPCASTLKEIASRRDAFDLLAQQQHHSPTLQSFYWTCATLDKAIQLITDYAGLSFLPHIPKCPPRPTSDTSSSNGDPKRPAVGNLPLPLCLIRLMVHNPIWSYACLMPTCLPAAPTADETCVSRRRTGFLPSEDALTLLGLADFSRPPTVLTGDSNTHSRYLAYRLIHKNLLPHRNLLQIRARRWNLLTHENGRHLRSRSTVATSTRRLYQLYAALSRQSPIDQGLLRECADEIAPCSTPRNIPLRCGSLAVLDRTELFSTDVPSLPKCVGYEAVLYNQTKERARRGEFSKLVHDTLTDFSQLAVCMWWSRVSGTDSAISVGNLVLKPEDTSDLSEQGLALLGPNYLPAIPVNLTPEGNLIVNTKAEPTLVQCSVSTAASSAIRTFRPDTTPNGDQHYACSPSESPNDPITEHIEAVLRKIRRDTIRAQSKSNMFPKRRSSVELRTKTLQLLSAAPRIYGKLPLPRLSDSQSSRRLALEDYRSKMKKQALRLSRSASATTRPSSESPPPPLAAEGNDEQTSEVQPYSAPSQDEGLSVCQQAADSLINQFHTGLDKLLVSLSDSVVGPLRFHPLAKTDTNQLRPSENITTSDNVVPDPSNVAPQLTSVFPGSCHTIPSRFLTRCRARGEASTADLFCLPASVRPEPQSTVDESDVHRARSLLDRCRAYLSTADYSVIVFTLRRLNQIVYNEQTVGKSPTYKRDVLQSLSIILSHLESHKCLWEDFVVLLTPEQARLLGLLPTYLNLTRVARVQRVLQTQVQRGKRFWKRLRNLADSCFLAARNSAANGVSESSGSTPNRTTTKSGASLFNRRLTTSKHFGLPHRLKGVRTKYVRFPISKTWKMMESTWKNRPILFAQMACLLNDKHTPYSDFEQGFDEIDLLARHPLGVMNSSATDDHDTDSEFPHQFDLLQEDDVGWEVCTSLSAAAARDRRSGNSSAASLTHQDCPCPCHSANPTTVLPTSNKPMKTTGGLAARHCISCSLKVYQGVVYVDNRNFRLRDVQITWPEGFRPKSNLRPVPPKTKLDKTHTAQPRLSSTTQCSTRAALRQLANSHASLSGFNDTGLNQVLPDMSRRRVSIEFIPTSELEPVLSNEDVKLEKTPSDDSVACTPSLPAVEPCVADLSINENTQSTYMPFSPSFWLVDDEAACFNTEAFAASRLREQSPENDGDSWHAEEDRQLLEFSKAQGVYRSRMFVKLAKQWIPKPDKHSKRRSSLELEARFKHLMHLTLGDAYDSELFRSPERVTGND